MGNKPRTVGHSVERILKFRNEVFDAIHEYVGLELSGASYEQFVSNIKNCITKISTRKENKKYTNLQDSTVRDVIWTAIYNSCINLLNKTISKKDLISLAWRLAANKQDILQGIPVPEWNYSTAKPEEVVVQVTGMLLSKNAAGQLMVNYKFVVLTGKAVGLDFWKQFSAKAVRYIAGQIGFSKPYNKFPFRDNSELINMRIHTEIHPNPFKPNSVTFKHIINKVHGRNQKLLKARAHIQPKCPNNYTHPCYQCHVGYDVCPAGTHSKSYEYRKCDRCKAETWHNPTTGTCNKCHRYSKNL